MEINKEPNKHLTYDERSFIEIGLNSGRNFTQIAKDLKKHRTCKIQYKIDKKIQN